MTSLIQEKKVTTLQAYNAVMKFLDFYFSEINSGYIAVLLSGMAFVDEETTADPAVWEDWTESLETKEKISATQAYNAMLKFLHIYFGWCTPENVEKKFAKLKLSKDGTIIKSQERENYEEARDTAQWFSRLQISQDGTIDQAIWKKWMECVDAALAEPEGTKLYLELE